MPASILNLVIEDAHAAHHAIGVLGSVQKTRGIGAANRVHLFVELSLSSQNLASREPKFDQ